MNVNCDCNKNICEAITITFPSKQTIMKHDMNKFNITQSKCRIQNLINWWIGKSLMCFPCLCHSKYHKSIMPPLQSDFLIMCAFFMNGYFKYLSYTSGHLRRMKCALAIWHIAGKPHNWLNFIWSKTWMAIKEIS